MPKLVIVSNRLPISVKKVDGKLEFSNSIGGLATGLASIGDSIAAWIGWPGIANDDLTEEDRVEIRRRLKKDHCHPVFLSQKLIHDYYDEYSNRVLWPLFHHLPLGMEPTKETWRAYQDANRLFSEEVLRLTQPDSMIWVHDYQLLLLPSLLREARPQAKIGFFLHIPFPKPSVWQSLAQAPQLTLGLLGADLIGFHTKSYSEHFLKSCRQLDIGTVMEHKVALVKRVVRVAEFPLGINYSKFAQATKKRFVQKEAARLKWKYRGKKVIVAFDRLDMTKGFVERLVAYRTLLKEHPELHKKVVMVMVGNPTRTTVPEYIKLREKVEKLVKDINAAYGTSRWKPVDYQYTVMNYQEIAALFGRADVGFITPIRDGMNLNAKEYIASQQKSPGILVLSESAGAAEELKEAIMVSHTKPRSLVDGLYKALTMRPNDLKRRVKTMQRHLSYFTAEKWADNFLEVLQKPTALPSIHRTMSLNEKHEATLLREYKAAAKRLLLLDYDGTLTPIVKQPEDATPDKALLKLLNKLAKDPRTDVVVISGRSKNDLQAWFGDLPIGLAAEHGALFRRAEGKNWHRTSSSPAEWQDQVSDIFNYYAEETPGARVERKEWALVWHYRNASPYYAQKHLVALRRLLRPIARKYELRVTEGLKVLEVQPREISKARISQEWLIHDHEFVLAIGDDATDEDMFAAVPPNAYSIKVGRGHTEANYRLPDETAALQLLKKLL